LPECPWRYGAARPIGLCSPVEVARIRGSGGRGGSFSLAAGFLWGGGSEVGTNNLRGEGAMMNAEERRKLIEETAELAKTYELKYYG